MVWCVGWGKEVFEWMRSVFSGLKRNGEAKVAGALDLGSEAVGSLQEGVETGV